MTRSFVVLFERCYLLLQPLTLNPKKNPHLVQSFVPFSVLGRPRAVMFRSLPLVGSQAQPLSVDPKGSLCFTWLAKLTEALSFDVRSLWRAERWMQSLLRTASGAAWMAWQWSALSKLVLQLFSAGVGYFQVRHGFAAIGAAVHYLDWW